MEEIYDLICGYGKMGRLKSEAYEMAQSSTFDHQLTSMKALCD
jgi:hypothetical protein